jgi:hypothetical protein
VTRASPAFKLPFPTDASHMPGKSGPGNRPRSVGPAGLAQASRAGRKMMATVEWGDTARPSLRPCPAWRLWMSRIPVHADGECEPGSAERVRRAWHAFVGKVCGARGAREAPKHASTCIKSVVHVVPDLRARPGRQVRAWSALKESVAHGMPLSGKSVVPVVHVVRARLPNTHLPA